MSFLDVDTSSAVEPKVVEADEEYEIRIVGATVNNDKNGKPYFLPRFEIVGEPSAKEFTKFMRLPHDEMNDKQRNNCLWQLKCFYEAFGITSPIGDENDIIGETAYAILGVNSDEEYGDQNYVKKFVVGN